MIGPITSVVRALVSANATPEMILAVVEAMESPKHRARRDSATAAFSVDAVVDAVAEHFGHSREEMLAHNRSQPLARHRQVAMFLARNDPRCTLPAIGAAIGGRDHTTVLYGCRTISALLASDDPIAADVDAIREKLA